MHEPVEPDLIEHEDSVSVDTRPQPIRTHGFRNTIASLVAGASILMPSAAAYDTYSDTRDITSTTNEIVGTYNKIVTMNLDFETGEAYYYSRPFEGYSEVRSKPLGEVIAHEKDGRIRFTIPSDAYPAQLTNSDIEGMFGKAGNLNKKVDDLQNKALLGMVGLMMALGIAKESEYDPKDIKTKQSKGGLGSVLGATLLFGYFAASTGVFWDTFGEDAKKLIGTDTGAISDKALRVYDDIEDMQLEVETKEDGAVIVRMKADPEKMANLQEHAIELSEELPDTQYVQDPFLASRAAFLPVFAAGTIITAPLVPAAIVSAVQGRRKRSGSEDN